MGSLRDERGQGETVLRIVYILAIGVVRCRVSRGLFKEGAPVQRVDGINFLLCCRGAQRETNGENSGYRARIILSYPSIPFLGTLVSVQKAKYLHIMIYMTIKREDSFCHR